METAVARSRKLKEQIISSTKQYKTETTHRHEPAAGLYLPAVEKSSRQSTVAVSSRSPHAATSPTCMWRVPRSTDSAPRDTPAPTRTPEIKMINPFRITWRTPSTENAKTITNLGIFCLTGPCLWDYSRLHIIPKFSQQKALKSLAKILYKSYAVHEARPTMAKQWTELPLCSKWKSLNFSDFQDKFAAYKSDKGIKFINIDCIFFVNNCINLVWVTDFRFCLQAKCSNISDFE